MCMTGDGGGGDFCAQLLTSPLLMPPGAVVVDTHECVSCVFFDPTAIRSKNK